MFCQFVLLNLACVVVKRTGYRLAQLTTCSSTIDSNSRHAQFSLLHVLAWTAACVPLLLLVRTLEPNDLYAFFRPPALLPATLVAFGLAAVSLAVIWFVLGHNSVGIRLGVVVLTPLAVGWFVKSLMFVLFRISYYQSWPSSSILEEFGVFGDHWNRSTALIGCFLASMLVFLRASGYRLVRER